MAKEMTRFEIRPYIQGDLDPLIVLLNIAIARRRNASQVVVEEFRQRVLDNPGFDELGLLLAWEGGLLVGAVHAIVPRVEIPLYSRLEGQGFQFGPYVREDARNKGIGRALLADAEAYLAGHCDIVWAHGLRAPFYHALEGPDQPYCGSTEIIGLTKSDISLLRLLNKTGYKEGDEQEVSMLARLYPIDEFNSVPLGLELIRVSPRQPWNGSVQWASVASGYGYEQYGDFEYGTIAITKGGVLMGHIQWYPMRQAGRVALYDLRLDPALRGLGIGRLLVERGLDTMWRNGFREVELHTSPQRNPVAYKMYQRFGFTEVEEWLPLRKNISR